MPLPQPKPEAVPAAAAVLLRIHRPDDAADLRAKPVVARRTFLRTAVAIVAAAGLPQVTEAVAIAEPATPAEPPLSPRMRLSEFFEQVYVPRVMHMRNRNSPKTIQMYRDSIGWWTELTGDPALCEITDETLYEKFAEGLRCAVYTRGLRGDLYAMRQSTAVKHMKHVRAVYFRAGPKKGDPKRPSFGILQEIEHLEVESPTDTRVKPPVTPRNAQAIFAACDHMKFYGTERAKLRVEPTRGPNGQVGDGGPGAPRAWRSAVATFYYGGRRFESVAALRWRMMRFINGRPFWDIPAGHVKGRKKGDLIYIHPHAYELLGQLPRESEDDLVYPFLNEHTHSYLLQRHRLLQDLAGVPADEINDYHGYKRGFVAQRFALGLTPALSDARRAARHEDDNTTTKYYVEIEPMLIDLFTLLDADWKPQAPVSKNPAANQRVLF